MKKRKFWLLWPLLCLMLVFGLSSPVAAVDAVQSFYGDLTIAGDDAPVGTEVIAKIAGVEYGSVTTETEGQYGEGGLGLKLVVEGPIEDSAIVDFYVTSVELGLVEVKTNETDLFDSGEFTELNLTVTIVDITAPMVVITELTPDPTNVNTPTFTGTATDTESNISSVEYKVDDGEWTAADAVDGIFDSLSEEYTLTTAELLDEVHTVYVRATDAATNTTLEANYASDSFTLDTVAPSVLSTTPEADSLSVAVDVVVSATFSEDIQAGDNFSGITISSGATGVSASIDGATLTIAHDAFAYETLYEVTIPAGAVNDLADNPLAEAEVWSFITRAEGPVSFPFTLPAGWNLLSTPILLDADSDTLEQILGESEANIEASWRWDVQNQQWEVPTGYELSPLEAVYLKVSSDASATAEFVPYQDYSELPSRELQPGLNLIGPAPALVGGVFPDMPLNQALISIAEAEGGLTGYTMVVSPAHNQLGWAYALGGEIEDLLAFNGYWVVMENADTLFGFSYTPTP